MTVDSEYKSVLQSDDCAADSNFIFDLDGASVAEAERLESELKTDGLLFLSYVGESD